MYSYLSSVWWIFFSMFVRVKMCILRRMYKMILRCYFRFARIIIIIICIKNRVGCLEELVRCRLGVFFFFFLLDDRCAAAVLARSRFWLENKCNYCYIVSLRRPTLQTVTQFLDTRKSGVRIAAEQCLVCSPLS